METIKFALIKDHRTLPYLFLMQFTDCVPMTQKEISKLSGVSGATGSKIIKYLLSIGAITITQRENDKREKLAVLTKKGLDIVSKITKLEKFLTDLQMEING
jgi:DNA-binding MarR family transcriptional regulator